MRRADSFEKTLMLGKIEGRRRGWDGWMTSPTQWTWVWVGFKSWCWTWRPGMVQLIGSQESDTTEWLNWTELLLGRKAMANIDCILKAEILLCQQMSTWSNLWFFLVVMYGCECWTITKAEHQRTDAFELWFWRKFLRILWTARKSKQSVLKEISTEYSLLKLKL